MGKKKSSTPPESFLLLPSPPSSLPIVDTHTHLASTFSFYRTRYKAGTYASVHDFARAMYAGRQVAAIVDVWCEAEAPSQGLWREFADSALRAEDRERVWGGMEYWFVMGVHPHEAKLYTDDVETHILEAMAHPRCVGWGEIGLDYHYTLSPRDTQQAVFARQLRHAVRLGKPLTIHTREAEEDTERILKAEVPREHKIHIHCFTDSPAFAARLLAHFPNLYIGITGVITYTSNPNTSGVIRNLVSSSPAPAPSSPSPPSDPRSHLRILLETDAPYMVPANLYDSLAEMKGKLPLCHSAMVPWTAAFVARVAREAVGAGEGEGEEWTPDRVMREARENARRVYGV